ncbi:DNA cytosine methyltransferase [Phenylobacterium soli]|uniref:Cytosine-specific methyltransferase n=1 Tax=Phenylobacterium soli TaxID=2170551 RepID=A0A328AAH1_9CAUL|nr:DNA cytosine methyltransferase [Phenylobacterium soli]RAK51610.1 DNA cytosine methyltransferase [Phenylobacterium soli]
MKKLRVLDLFSGIGGFSLGLERTGGFETVAFCEIEPFCRRVLAKHWPEVPCYDDVRTLSAERLAADGFAVDVICGGFPCQDISNANPDAEGIEGERSGLWSEIARLVRELRPRLLIVENVAALLGRGLDRVLGDLAALGYDAEWDCIPASAVGAPHQRDRIWIVAYPRGEQHESKGDAFRRALAAGLPEAFERNTRVPVGADAQADAFGSDAHGFGSHRAGIDQLGSPQLRDEQDGNAEQVGPVLDDTNGERLQELDLSAVADRAGFARRRAVAGRGVWAVEPALGRVADGVPHRVDRLKALGNAVVPQIPELIGRAILESLQTQSEAA